MKRIISLILSIALAVCLLSGCDLRSVVSSLREQMVSSLYEPVEGSYLVYELDQALLDGFYDALEVCEELSVAGEDMDRIDQAAERLDEMYMELIDQEQIAYILYCTDQSSQEFSRQYLEATQYCAQAEADYNAMIRRVYLSDTPVRDALFADWTQEQIDIMLRHTDEVARLEQRNTELTVAYHELDPENYGEDMIALYNELVANNNRIAEIYGYPDYYTYASRIVYGRDYGQQELERLRQYVCQYLPSACDSLTDSFYSSYDRLDEQQTQQLSNLLLDAWDALDTNYVQLYLQDLPEPAGGDMLGMFSDDRAVFTGYHDALSGAFTVWIDGLPFCYFGPNYQDSETLIHELGHYCGGLYMEPWGMSIDFCETQSQGNEWLFLCFLQEHLQPQVHDCLSDYKLMAELMDVLGFVILDEFEQRIYCHEKAGSLTLEEYDKLLEEVAEGYGGIDYISENILDLRTYWKLVLLESPVYYLSYAVSSCAAIDLYMMALEDETQAREVYCRLTQEADGDKGFLENITACALSGPFEEALYQKIGKIMEKNQK